MNPLKTTKEKCIECPLCQKECRFLKKYGTPKYIAETYDPRDRRQQSLPFECSLCGLCAAICPEDLCPQEMFLEWRADKIVFIPYAVTSFICMLPACIAFIVFSSSLLDIIKGKIPPAFIIGIGLIIIVLLAPVFYRYSKSRKEFPDIL